MADSTPYRKQVALILRVLPIVAQENCFALKGGTAINLFIRNMPRLSVDIDLAYLLVQPRDESLQQIDTSLKKIASRIEETVLGTKVQTVLLRGTDRVVKLLVNTHDAQIKIEVTPVLRGTVFPPQTLAVTEKVQEQFGFAEIKVVSFEDLFGGKLVAALDRQHPRDLYDVRLLLANEGLTRDLFRAFVVYLISHDRPMSEIIAPNLRDIQNEYEHGFAGMTVDQVSREDLEETRMLLIKLIHEAFTDNDREFLLSIKQGEPQWDLLEIPGIDQLPAIRWKVQNLGNLKPAKREELLVRLKTALTKNPFEG
jgi:predicted nucleotidyltransferase component of viral defense system